MRLRAAFCIRDACILCVQVVVVVGGGERPGEIELTVLLGRSRTVGRFGDTYRISIVADGRSQPSLEAVGREMSEAWTAWHDRFVGCLPEPINPWNGK